ncbi:MAG: acyltransferase [Solirubrobacteraceae bacterium]|nr:acyltransferase [Solirubrobacteraceae bacterium]
MSASGLRSTARALRLRGERARFELWARRLDARLRRAGGRLKLDAPHGAHFYELPAVEVHPYGGKAGTLTIRLGEHVQLGRGQILDVWAAADNTLALGDRVTFRAGTRIQLRGGSVRIGEDSTIRDYCLLDAMDGGEIVLGARVQFGAQVALHALQRVQLGDDAAAGERVSIFDSDHRHDGSSTTNYEQPVAIAPVVIGANTFLGANSLLLRGVRMGPNGMLGGSSLVRGGEYPGGVLYAGSPAREIRPLAPDLGARPAERR